MATPPEKHVAVLPYPPTSHARPLANLVLRLAAAAPRVRFSFLAIIGYNDILSGPGTPANVKVYDVIPSPWMNPSPSESVRGKVQRFLEGAPTNFETAITAAEEAAGMRVSCLLTDAFLTLACKIAEKMQVKWVPVYVGSPYIASAYIHIDEIVQMYNLPDQEASSRSDKTLEGIPGLSRLRIKDLPDVFNIGFHNNTFLLFRVFRELGSVLPRANAVVMSSYEEVNSTALLEDLKSKFNELLLVGSLTASFSPPPMDLGSDGTGCLKWLDKQKHHSVAYISFGSVTDLPPEEMFVLAEALEACKTSYLWSLKDDQTLSLPPGFEERTSSNGKIVPWAPQNQVLWHPSIGVHVTHCGYISMFESVAAGVPLICRPLWADNKINALVVEEEWGIGVTISGEFMSKNEMIKCLEMTIGGDEAGKEMRMKIKALKKVLMDADEPSGGSASRDLKTLVDIVSS